MSRPANRRFLNFAVHRMTDAALAANIADLAKRIPAMQALLAAARREKTRRGKRPRAEDVGQGDGE
ncbi:hypothetical protein [Marilutibacter aestuarii]|uniref:Uncharacterized protein n=1 Tax=Marilutibacter aestuarii TaxID=1706195 RepID=A0A508AMQ8_9GAMM|nr:hypothetical protein [Lysobacter aestuarii]TQD51206.1 hypothetical protein FKV25_01885 [Lysobacter aestuarii]